MRDPVQGEPSRSLYWVARKVLKGVDAGEEEAKHDSFVAGQRYGQTPEERWEFISIRIVRNF